MLCTSITNSTGGCSGPVWGTLFMRTGMAFRGKDEITLKEASDGLKSAIDGIMKRGGAHLGDKTLLDALDPIANSLAASRRLNGKHFLKSGAFSLSIPCAYECG